MDPEELKILKSHYRDVGPVTMSSIKRDDGVRIDCFEIALGFDHMWIDKDNLYFSGNFVPSVAIERGSDLAADLKALDEKADAVARKNYDNYMANSR